jgi:hypothetical protein
VIKSLKDYLKDKEKYKLTYGKIYNSIKLLYEFLSQSNVGFLKGDLHHTTIYKLSKDVMNKLNKAR